MVEFLEYFILFLITPFFRIMIILLVNWILLINHLKKKAGGDSKTFLTLLGVFVGVLIVIAVPMAFAIIDKFSGPIIHM